MRFGYSRHRGFGEDMRFINAVKMARSVLDHPDRMVRVAAYRFLVIALLQTDKITVSTQGIIDFKSALNANFLDDARSIIRKDYSEYLRLTKDACESYHESMTEKNHSHHNHDPEYQKYILEPLRADPTKWTNKKALDFGCGCGRNIKNLLDVANFERVDGCDISKQNAEYARAFVLKHHDPERCGTWETDGYTLQPAEDEEYDFIMSHLVFQHIGNWSIRYSLLADIYRVLKPGGRIALHFLDLAGSAQYYQDFGVLDDDYGEGAGVDFDDPAVGFDIKNCRVEDPSCLQADLERIGFTSCEIFTGTDPFCYQQSYYAWGEK